MPNDDNGWKNVPYRRDESKERRTVRFEGEYWVDIDKVVNNPFNDLVSPSHLLQNAWLYYQRNALGQEPSEAAKVRVALAQIEQRRKDEEAKRTLFNETLTDLRMARIDYEDVDLTLFDPTQQHELERLRPTY